MSNDSFDKIGAEDTVSSAPGFNKEEFLEKAKSGAIEKVASFSGRMQDPYPSPFLNLSDTKIPRTSLEIFRWCKYYYMFDPLISGAINALSTFPISEIYLEDKNNKDDSEESEMLKLYEKVLFKNLDIYNLLIEIGIDYYLYGNCFIFGEMHINDCTGMAEWKNVIRLDPTKITIDHNPATNETKYKWQIPQRLQHIVRKKAPRKEYDAIPEKIKEAVRKKKALIISKDNIYHLKRPSDSSGSNSVWGTPIVANVLKLLMYRNTLRQAQEAIAREHIVPMRLYYIDKTDSYDPSTNWRAAAENLSKEIQKSVKDPNHKVVSPVPVNVLTIGGQGKQLMLTPEIEQVQSEILAGMNIPREFLFGGVSYSGSSISLKILENNFITYRLLLKDFIDNFLIKGMAKARREWINEKDDKNLITSQFQDLKMQDDVQQKQIIVQLNSQGKCSDDLLWKTLGIDSDKMKMAIEREALARIELETKVENAKIQSQIDNMKLQEELQIKQMEMQMRLQQKQQSMMQDIQPQSMEQQEV
ncbi:MAG: hypothetical protein RR420_01165, partial [Anaerovoracaceae bacterium]